MRNHLPVFFAEYASHLNKEKLNMETMSVCLLLKCPYGEYFLNEITFDSNFMQSRNFINAHILCTLLKHH
jgi:hypothetical protein